MVKKFEVVIKVIGDGTEDKKKELIGKIVEKIKITGEASLGNLQASLTIEEVKGGWA
jgi:hypothetical protein